VAGPPGITGLKNGNKERENNTEPLLFPFPNIEITVGKIILQ
jgi:hypothetical protein